LADEHFKDIDAIVKMLLGQLEVDRYGNARKLKGISHFAEIAAIGLDGN